MPGLVEQMLAHEILQEEKDEDKEAIMSDEDGQSKVATLPPIHLEGRRLK